jgi:K+-transporting ATPase KdpF subunit
LREAAVIYLTALITALLFVYLGVALVRPEWF